MSRTIEIPDEDYARIQRHAGGNAMSRIVEVTDGKVVPAEREEAGSRTGATPARTMADRFAGRLGVIDSGDGRLSENTGEKFAAHLEAKRRAGHL